MQEIVADESVDFRIISALRQNGYTVVAITEHNPSITDSEVLKIAEKKKALLITEDKDFGELTFRLKKKNFGILLLRLAGIPIEEKITKVLWVLKKFEEVLPSSFIVIAHQKIRVKNLN